MYVQASSDKDDAPMSMEGSEKMMPHTDKPSPCNHQSEFVNVSGVMAVYCMTSLCRQILKLTLCNFPMHSLLPTLALELLREARCTCSLAGLWSGVF